MLPCNFPALTLTSVQCVCNTYMVTLYAMITCETLMSLSKLYPVGVWLYLMNVHLKNLCSNVSAVFHHGSSNIYYFIYSQLV